MSVFVVSLSVIVHAAMFHQYHPQSNLRVYAFVGVLGRQTRSSVANALLTKKRAKKAAPLVRATDPVLPPTQRPRTCSFSFYVFCIYMYRYRFLDIFIFTFLPGVPVDTPPVDWQGTGLS